MIMFKINLVRTQYDSQMLIDECMKWMFGCHINVSNDKEMFDFSNCSTSSKHYNNSKK